MAHPKEVLAAFQLGEARFIFARYRSGEPGLYELINGTANDVRDYLKSELLCPVIGCASPDLNTVHRKRHHHHRRHISRAKENDHSPESIFHLQGKAEFAKWARSVRPTATVVEVGRPRFPLEMTTAR